MSIFQGRNFVEGIKEEYSLSTTSLYSIISCYAYYKAGKEEGMNMRNNSFVIDDVVIVFKERVYKWTFPW